ncbi:MAG: DMT family transporter [Candidatus Thermoplasmatota archaeon]|nr:DMT family transporter [Candidatus Thermoplasmatota archaeon]
MAAMSETRRAYVAVLTAMVSVSVASVLIKWSETDPFVLAAYRLAFTCTILLPYMLWTGGFSNIRSFDRKESLLVLLSGIALAFHFGFWVVSLTLTLVATSVILVTSHPIFVAAVSHFLLHDKVKRIAAAGIAIAFSGVVVIAISDYSVGAGTLLGDLFAFVGGICAGIYFLSGRVARQTIDIAPYAFSVYGISAVLLFVAGGFAGDPLVVTAPRELLLFLLMAIFPTILGHTMFNYALKKLPAHIISTSVLGEPVGASILAYFLLPDEIPGVAIVIGGTLVVIGLYIVLAKGYDRG